MRAPVDPGEAEARTERVFGLEELQARRACIVRKMIEQKLDAVVLTNPVSTYYLTGYCTFAVRQFQAYLLDKDGRDAFLTWELELPGVQVQSDVRSVHAYRTGEDKFAAAAQLLRGFAPGAKRVGLETDGLYLTARDYRHLSALMGAVAEVVPLDRFVKDFITRKSEAELAYLRASAAVTDQAMKAAVDATSAGVPDNEIAAAAVSALVRAGGEFTCNFPIVTSGWRSGIPHTTYKRRRIERGDVVFIELGAPYQRYNTALMRTVFVGEPPDGARALAEAALHCLNRVLATAGPGVPAKAIAQEASALLPLGAEGLVFHNVYGYSVGIGFPPTWADDAALEITAQSEFTLEPGMVFHSTISPRIFKNYGIAVSETWAVTSSGIEVLTKFDRSIFQH
jgi:Xaa-Pro dipeptidase